NLIDAAQLIIDALNETLTQAQQDRDAAKAQVVTLQGQITALQAQLAAIQGVKVFDRLEEQIATVAGGSVANTSGNPGVAADAQSVPTDKEAFREIIPNGKFEDKYWFWQPLQMLLSTDS